MNIEIKNPNHLTDFLHGLHNKLENLMFSIILKIPEKLIPRFLIEWLDRYTTKRINQLNQEIIKDRWKNVYLQKAVDEISNRRQVSNQ